MKQFILAADWHLLVKMLDEQASCGQQPIQLGTLTVGECMQAMQSTRMIQAASQYPSVLLNTMDSVPISVRTWHELVVLLFKLMNQLDYCYVLIIAVENQHYTLEISINQVIFYGVGQVTGIQLPQLITRLQQYMAILPISPQKLRTTLYRHNGIDQDALLEEYQIQVHRWRKLYAMPLLQFITL